MASGVTGPAEQTRILDWSRAHHRDLPWRRTRDPWAVLVSEVMLQQTQVDRVVPRWRAVRGAVADDGRVRRSVAGGGARRVAGPGLPAPCRGRCHASAQRIEADHGGDFPDDLDTLLTLPGIGPYTARAVLAFAFGRDVAVVDTNVGRVLARRHGAPLGAAAAQARADEWVPPGHGWEWNQGLLDVGARCCRPRDPACGDCPVAPSVHGTWPVGPSRIRHRAPRRCRVPRPASKDPPARRGVG